MMTGRTLILTSTIRPRPDAAFVGHLDPDARRNDYLKAVAFYTPLLGQVFDHIIFADNSGELLDAVVDAAGGDPRFIPVSYEGLDYPPIYGRGYGEMKIIERLYGMPNLPLRQSRFVWKVTGRYVVTNIARIVADDLKMPDLLCHCRNVPRRWTELFLFGWSSEGYEKFVSRLAEQFRHDVTDLWPEILMNALVIDKRGYGGLRARCRFARTPWVVARRGLNGLPFETRRQSVKHYVREAARLVTPFFWV